MRLRVACSSGAPREGPSGAIVRDRWRLGSYPVILGSVKTAISIPDETFDQAERRAASLGMSRSEFFTKAAQRYLAQLDEEALTAAIDASIDLVGADDSRAAAVSSGHRRLAETGDEW